ncbi:hypothetical protein EV702DRAFT_1203546 [Suillus placidus]|uniref:Uncharacterized protein n=1 Tax=Suillus placidus TaxID=48579 RepID=A0A9P6ZKP8_9AGAM|nr:hypothetical protein EV702DRAFT_1203546 [Suillus placidus]
MGACLAPEASQLAIQEKIWRSIAARELGNFNRGLAMQIDLMFEDKGAPDDPKGPIPPAELDKLLKEIPTDFLKDDAAIFTRLTDPQNPRRIVWITKRVQYGEDLTPEELNKVKGLVAEYADIFACSLGEVIPVPGAIHRLNIPDRTMFNLQVHQRPLTPPQ